MFFRDISPEPLLFHRCVQYIIYIIFINLLLESTIYNILIYYDFSGVY